MSIGSAGIPRDSMDQTVLRATGYMYLDRDHPAPRCSCPHAYIHIKCNSKKVRKILRNRIIVLYLYWKNKQQEYEKEYHSHHVR